MFEEKVAVVTGGARGIGRATVEMLVAGGARVTIADADAQAIDAAREIGASAAPWIGDLTGDGAAEKLIGETIERWGRLDILVNNAGYTLDAPVHKLSDGDFQAMLDIHTLVPFRLIRALAPHFRDAARRERAAGEEVFRKIVNVSSMAAYGNPGQANYSSAKAAMIGLTKTVAREWGSFNVNVNAVAFGFIETRLTQPKGEDSTIEVSGRTIPVGVPEQTRAMLASMIPLGRSGTTTEAAGAIAFLCGAWSDYMTGQVLNVGGGVPFGMSA
jgi:3-oxoacyl-[acyl-carrier protein] reductase